MCRAGRVLDRGRARDGLGRLGEKGLPAGIATAAGCPPGRPAGGAWVNWRSPPRFAFAEDLPLKIGESGLAQERPEQRPGAASAGRTSGRAGRRRRSGDVRQTIGGAHARGGSRNAERAAPPRARADTREPTAWQVPPAHAATRGREAKRRAAWAGVLPGRPHAASAPSPARVRNLKL